MGKKVFKNLVFSRFRPDPDEDPKDPDPRQADADPHH